MEMEHFKSRHIGISDEEQQIMLEAIGVSTLDELIDQTIPTDIRYTKPMDIPKGLSELEYAEEIGNGRESASYRY